jgi:hypothetical protein
MNDRVTMGGDKTMVLNRDPTRSLGLTNTATAVEGVNTSFYKRGWRNGYWAGLFTVVGGLMLLIGVSWAITL